MIDISKIFQFDLPKWLTAFERKSRSAHVHRADGESTDPKMDSAVLLESTQAQSQLTPLLPADKSQAAKQHKSPRLKSHLEPEDANAPSSAQWQDEVEADVQAALPSQTVGSEWSEPVLYAQAQTEVVSDAPVGLPTPSQAQAAMPVSGSTLSMPDWVDAVKAVDKIPFSGVLGGLAVAAAVGAKSSVTPSDTTPPLIALAVDKSNLSKGQNAKITFTLSEPSANFTVDDVQVSGGTLSNFSGSGTSYSAIFTPTANSTLSGVISVDSGKFSDAAGNQNADGADANNSVALTIDTVSPSIVLGTDRTTLNAAQSANITFSLSDAATDFTLADVTVSGGTLSNFSGSGTSYSATFTPTAGSTAPGLVSVASGKFTDASGHPNADGADANNRVTLAVDANIPVMPVAQLEGSWTVNPQVTLSINSGSGSAQDVVVEVFPDAAPGTVANWLAYVNTAFYSNLIFHRVISGFMVQAGAFTSDLVQHTATYSAIPLETTQTTGLSNVTGTIAMARTNAADSATSQFFINVADNTFLDYSNASAPGYAVFGQVVSGMSMVNAIAGTETGTANGMSDVPNNPITLNSVSQSAAGTAYSSTGKIALAGLESGAHFSYSLDGSSTWTPLAISQTQIDLGSTLSPGSHTVAVKQIDSAGNSSAQATVQFIQYTPDAAHSVIDLLTDTSGGALDGTATDNITQSTSLSLTADLSNAFAGQTLWLMDHGAKVASAVADSSGNLAWQGIAASQGDHLYTLYDPVHHIRVVDANISTSELLVRVV